MTEKLKDISNSWVLGLISKFALICFIPWSVWITKEVLTTSAFRSNGDRFTRADGLELRVKMVESESRLSAQVTREVQAIRKLLTEFEREFSADFVRKDEIN